MYRKLLLLFTLVTGAILFILCLLSLHSPLMYKASKLGFEFSFLYHLNFGKCS